jgi:stage V sporulation protein D (sporulation-specific penicillin-binding protein)
MESGIRMIWVGVIITLGFVAVIANLSHIIFVKGGEYKQAAYAQQTKSQIISSNRGTIYDSNGEILAVSVSVDTISFNPGKIQYSSGETVEDEVVAKEFSELFELDYDETLEKVKSSNSVVVIARKVETDIVNKLKDWMSENKITSGINIDEDYKRYYPNGSLASTLIGFCGTDNTGSTGLEERWNDILVGTSGILTVTSDVNGEAISDENEEYIPAENGSNIYLTIDSEIQGIAEKYLKQAVEENSADYGGVILMNPQNGDILAMANYPDYDLNDPQNPIYTGLSSSWDSLTSEEKSNARYNLWSNKNVSSLYEPGSTFKTIVSSIALEEGLVQTDQENDFFCSGKQEVQGVENGIECWSKNPHGYQTLREALEHSCNPSFIQLGQRIGIKTMYKYFEAYGLFDKCGTDIAYTPTSIFTDLEKVGPAELATTSFGQRFSITPLQLITAVSAISNGGTLIEPRIVKQIENTDTGSITTVDVNTVRKVISEETANKVKDMMLSVVEDGTGGNAKVTGYEVGGKSGTSEPAVGKEDEGYVASFIAISPIENTQVVCLIILYNPNGNSHQGGTICAPVAGEILSEVLPYLNVNGTITTSGTDTTDTSYANSKTVIDAKGMTVAAAKEKLQSSGFNVVVNTDDENSSIVTDQMPKAGAYLESGATIYLYTSDSEVRTSITVPDVKNMSLSEAQKTLKDLNLNVTINGTSGLVTSQSVTAGTEVAEGTVINITLKENTSGGQ